MKSIILLFCAITVLVEAAPVSGSGPLPQYCASAADSDCLKEAAVKAIPFITKGLPQFNIARTDPFFVEKIDASTNTLKLVVYNSTITGLKDCKPKKIKIDADSKKINIKLLCDVDLHGQYVMKGSILVLPIEGKGKIHVGLNKFLINFDLNFENNFKNDKTYMKVTDWKYNFDLKGKSTIDFEGLFNGNELLGRAAKELIANNGNEVVLEIGPPAIKTVATKVVSTATKLFDHLAIEDLFL